MNTMAKRIKDLRKARNNMTQEELAEKTGVGIATIRRYEASKHEPFTKMTENIRSIATYFGVYPEWLLTGKGHENAREQLREEAKENETIQRAVTAIERMRTRHQITELIEDYYGLGDIPKPPKNLEYLANKTLNDIDVDSISHEEWEELFSIAQAKNDLMNSIFNFMDVEIMKYKERYGVE